MDALIQQKRTGPPKELSEKLGISERWLYIFLDELKTELDCTIRYDRSKCSYIYEKQGKVVLGFEKISVEEKKEISGGLLRKNESLYLFVQ